MTSGECLVDTFRCPGRRLAPEVNRVQVLVSDDGDTRLGAATATTEHRRAQQPPAASA